MNSNRDFQLFVHRYAEGLATTEDVATLNDLLRGDSELRWRFAEMMNLDSALTSCAAGWAIGDSPMPSDRRRSAVPRSRSAVWSKRTVLACAMIVCAVIVGTYWMAAIPAAYAVVASNAGTSELAIGSSLRGEWHTIAGGSIEIETLRGVRLVVEAPAEFRFESAQRLNLRQGRLAADVPPTAKGFTVSTPTGDAVDWGTRFGVDVPESGGSEIHVFQGEVIAEPRNGSDRQSLRGGEAYSLQSDASERCDLRLAAFIQSDEMALLSAGRVVDRKARSDAASAKLRRDPSLIALADFESDNRPPGTYRVVQGRWPGSRAPEFANVGDHLQFDVGGDRAFSQLTLAAWVRLDKLGQPYQSLIHTDGWDQNNPGQVHWMVTRHTTMRLALFGNTLAPGSVEREDFPDSRTSVLPEQCRWVHLASVYDADRRSVRFYLNGAFDGETQQEIAHPARLGPARIGNWNRHDRKLSGRIDELVLLGRAMNDEEIRSLYVAGNPYR